MDGEVLQSSCAKSDLPGKPRSSLSVQTQPFTTNKSHRENIFLKITLWWEMQNLIGLGELEVVKLLRTFRKRISCNIPVYIVLKQKVRIGLFPWSAPSTVTGAWTSTGWISWSPFSPWQHPQFILNNKFCQSVHIFQLLCEILIANLL